MNATSGLKSVWISFFLPSFYSANRKMHFTWKTVCLCTNESVKNAIEVFRKKNRKMNEFQEKENAEGHEIVSPVLC